MNARKARPAITSDIRRAIVAIVTAALTCLTVSPALSEPLNILLLVADDLGWNDLPYFTQPVDWGTQPSTWSDAEATSGRMWPAHNRFAARAYACRDTSLPGCSAAGAPGRFYAGPSLYHTVQPADFEFPAPLPGTNPPSPPSAYDVNMTKTLDDLGLQTNGDCRRTVPPGQAQPHCPESLRRADILPGFGGLKRLVDEGIAFPRFYANSAKCTPSRAALMSGRYPPRTGVTGNFADLPANEITIAEFLKQGCDGAVSTEDPAQDPKELWCRKDGSPNAGPYPCPCYLSNDSANCEDRACYRTGLIGKWHMGGSGPPAPWNQGFDEVFGFSGGSRHYWSTGPLQCSPMPSYCSGSGDPTVDDHKMCSTDTDCGSPPAECLIRGLNLGTTSNPSGAAGSKTVNTCEHGPPSANDPTCCSPAGNGKGKGKYDVKKHYDRDRLTENPVPPDSKGIDKLSTGDRPCSGNDLSEDANCAYLTRIERDQARNFIVRNAQFQPWFLTVAFHAPHFSFAAPLRTEDHYKTEIDTQGNAVAARLPNGATKYWSVMEELDAAVGQILEILDRTGVCEDDVTKECHDDNECDSDHCVQLGRNNTSTSDATSCSPSVAASVHIPCGMLRGCRAPHRRDRVGWPPRTGVGQNVSCPCKYAKSMSAAAPVSSRKSPAKKWL